jgi:hypothetical protein
MHMRTIVTLGLTFVGALLFASGCEKHAQGRNDTDDQSGAKAGNSARAHDDHDHDHEHVHIAPHGGLLVELGEHVANAEIVFDSGAATLTLYTFDGCAENAVRIKQESISLRVARPGTTDVRELTLAARGNALTGEKPGDSAEFSVQDDLLKGVAGFDGVIVKVEIKGQTYSDVKFRWPKSGQ